MKNLCDYEKTQSATADLTCGAFKNESFPGAKDGTDIMAEHIQDIAYPLFQVLQLAGIVPNGELEDGNTKMQFLQALTNIGLFKHSDRVLYRAGILVWSIVGNDLTIYRSNKADNNGDLSDSTCWTKILTIDGNQKINFHVGTNISGKGGSMPVFCFNSGPVDSNGNAALITYENDTLTLNVPAVGTTAEGETFAISENIQLDVSGLEDGKYNVFYNVKTGGLEVYKNQIFWQKTEPQNAQLNDIHINTSVMPYLCKMLTTSGWVESSLVCNAIITSVSGGGSKLMNRPYNVLSQNAAGTALPLFTPMLSDHILEGDEAVGRALQGSLITMTYPQAVEKVKTAYASGSEQIAWKPLTLPTFTSNTTDGITVSDSRDGENLYELVNGYASSSYYAVGHWNTYWFNIDFGKPAKPTSYTIQADSNGAAEYPRAWTLQASNDGVEWTTIDTQSGQSFSLGQSKTYTINNTTPYNQYRLVFTNGVEANNSGQLRQITFGGGEIQAFTYRKTTNKWQIADISQKDYIDELFANTGVAKFYILDSVNNQFYLPREKWFPQFTTDPDKINQYNEAGVPDFTAKFNCQAMLGIDEGCEKYNSTTYTYSKTSTLQSGGVEIKGSYSNPIYGNSDTVQPPSSNWYLYYVVGDTIVNESQIDVGNVLSDLQLKADLNLSNVEPSAYFKNMAVGWGIPDYTAGVSKIWNTLYTAETAGVVYVASKAQANAYITINGEQIHFNGNGNIVGGLFPVAQGDTYRGTGGESQTIKFYPLKGVEQ